MRAKLEFDPVSLTRFCLLVVFFGLMCVVALLVFNDRSYWLAAHQAKKAYVATSSSELFEQASNGECQIEFSVTMKVRAAVGAQVRFCSNQTSQQ